MTRIPVCLFEIKADLGFGITGERKNAQGRAGGSPPEMTNTSAPAAPVTATEGSAAMDPQNASMDFRAAFVADLKRYGEGTASATRLRHHIPGSNAIGATVLALWKAGTITPAGTGAAQGTLSHRRLTRKWKLVPEGGRG
ncbi:MAG: hypothetical protein ABSE73_09015 [Planctomycetota bacterium]